MNYPPVAGIDIGKNFSEMCVLSPSNEICYRIKIYHDSSDSINKAVCLLKKQKRTLQLGLS